jgi:branched-chain amino acid transport system ATP-binding protein
VSATAILDVQNLTKDFGGFHAVSKLTFSVEPGEILGLVGPNGAGKTTTFNLITGFSAPTAGRILFKGQEVTGRPPHDLAQRGLVRTFQNTRVFARLSVEDNIRIGCFKREQGGLRRTLFGIPRDEADALAARVEEIVAFTGLEERRGRIADDLAYGEQRTLEIAIALGADPELLLLDEPFAGMNPAEADACMALIHRTRERGVTVVLVDHHMDTLMKHCHRLVVMHHGEKLAEGRPEEIQHNPKVIETYLGRGDGA